MEPEAATTAPSSADAEGTRPPPPLEVGPQDGAGPEKPPTTPLQPAALKRASTLPANPGTAPEADHSKVQSWLAERLPAGQQAFTEAMLLRMTSGTCKEQSPTSEPTVPPQAGQPLDQAKGSPPGGVVAIPAPGLLSETGPLGRLGRSRSVAQRSEVVGECKICYDKKPLPLVCAACPTGQGACADCLRTYFTTAVNDALYAMPMIKCALCRGRVPTTTWAPFVDQAIYEKYLGNASALLSLRCPNCDETASFFTPMSFAASAVAPSELQQARRRASVLRAELQREELWCDLLSARAAAVKRRGFVWGCRGRPAQAISEQVEDARARASAAALVNAWERFEQAEASADEFVARLHSSWPPGKGARPPRGLRRAARHRAPLCIEDPERRLAVQLAWFRRYPKIRTPCCRARVCFKCKVRGWHRGLSCEERQRREARRDAQFCPNCNVPTTRSDGCDHIRCVCGTEWTWQEGGSGTDTDENGGGRDDLDRDDEDFSDDDSESSNGGSLGIDRNRTPIELAALNRFADCASKEAEPSTEEAGGGEAAAAAGGKAPAHILEVLIGAPRPRYPPPPQRRAAAPRRHRPIRRFQRSGSSLEEVDEEEESSDDDAGSGRHEGDTGAGASSDAAAATPTAGAEEEPPSKKARPGVEKEYLSEEDDLGISPHPFLTRLTLKEESTVEAPAAKAPAAGELSPTLVTWAAERAAAEALKAAVAEVKEAQRAARELSGEGAAEEAETPAEEEKEASASPSVASSRRVVNGEGRAIPIGEGAPNAPPPPPLISPQQMPLALAVRARNLQGVRVMLRAGAAASEPALRELLRIPDAARQELEDEIRPYLATASVATLPVWARIYFGLEKEGEPLRLDLGIGTLALIALRRQRDPALRQRYERLLREHLSDEWFEALQAEAATEELRSELLQAAERKRSPDSGLIEELLALGADPQVRGDRDSEGDDCDSTDREMDFGEHQHRSEAGSSGDHEDHGSISSYWCPATRDGLSTAELMAVHGSCSEPIVKQLLGATFEESAALGQEGSATQAQVAASSSTQAASSSSTAPPGDAAAASSSSQPQQQPQPDGAEAAADAAAARRRYGRLLTLAVYNRSLAVVKQLLKSWPCSIGPPPSSVWRALHSVVPDTTRRELEVELCRFIATRGLDAAEVPLWALVQLGARTAEHDRGEGTSPEEAPQVTPAAGDGEGEVPAASTTAASDDLESKVMSLRAAMHTEACTKLEALLAVEEGGDNASEDSASQAPVRQRTFIAVRRCSDAAAREHYEAFLLGKLQERAFRKRRAQAATRELLAELRAALTERRTPDATLAAELLQLGASPCARECDDELNDGEDDPLTTRTANDDGFYRTPLQLLAMNRYAAPKPVGQAVARAIELRANPNRGRYGEKPLVLAIRSHNWAATKALLAGGANLTVQALVALRRVSDKGFRRQVQGAFMEQFQSTPRMSLQDVGLWAAVQCGFQGVACRAIEGDAPVDFRVLMALRRCKEEETKKKEAEVIEQALRKKLGDDWYENLRAEAATSELALELREALQFERVPDEVLVKELLELGANPQARGMELDESDMDSDLSTPDGSDSESGSSSGSEAF